MDYTQIPIRPWSTFALFAMASGIAGLVLPWTVLALEYFSLIGNWGGPNVFLTVLLSPAAIGILMNITAFIYLLSNRGLRGIPLTVVGLIFAIAGPASLLATFAWACAHGC